MSQPSDKTSARKFWWIIMLLPIGLFVGTITSLVHHLRQNEEAESQEEYQVAIALNTKDIHTGMERALLLGERNLSSELGKNNIQAARRFIQGAVSPGGTGVQFTEAKAISIDSKNYNLAYTDVIGSDEDSIVAVIIETAGSRNKAEAAKLGITPSLIRSLTETAPLQTVRFVLTPVTTSAQEHAAALGKNTLTRNQKIVRTIVLKGQAEVDITDANDWKIFGSDEPAVKATAAQLEITHPILLTETITEITPAHSKAALKATDQLRNLILKIANS